LFKEKFSKMLPADDPLQEKINEIASKVWEVPDYLNSLGLAEIPGNLTAVLLIISLAIVPGAPLYAMPPADSGADIRG
jgi:hypothetical protein